MTSLVTATNVSKHFKAVRAVDNVSFEIEKGKILGLFGPNGAGKTTLLNMISGFYPPDQGTIHLGTEDITRLKPAERAIKGIARTFQNIALFNGLWRSFVWDVWVTPEHNDPDWNLRKIVFVHLPVLLLVLTHLSLYQDVALFLGFETVALVGSAFFMRMPWPID